MFDFLGGALRGIGNSLNAELRDFKRALFSQFFKSKSNSNSIKPKKINLLNLILNLKNLNLTLLNLMLNLKKMMLFFLDLKKIKKT